MRVLDGPDRKALGTAGTPGVDLLLVILVIAGLVQVGRMAWSALPRADAAAPARLDSIPAPHQVILTLQSDGTFLINGFGVDARGLGSRLRRIFADRPVKLLFVQAAPDRTFGDVQDAVRIALGAGVETVGYLPPDVDVFRR